MMDEIEPELTDHDNIIALAASRAMAAYHRSNPCLQLCHPEWLGDVVVGTTVKCRHFSALQTDRRQDDDRHITPLTYSMARLEAIDVGETDVQNYDVGCFEGDLGKALFTRD